MGLRPSCRSCRHCAASQGGETGWCHLRRLAIHPEFASELWCHHWTVRPPRLPLSGATEVPAAQAGSDAAGSRSASPHPPHSEAHHSGPSRQLTLEALLPQF